MAMLSRRLNVKLLILVTTSAIVFAMWSGGDSVSKRRWTHRHIAALAAKVKEDPNDTQYLKELFSIANGRFSFGATIAMSSIGRLGSDPTLVNVIRPHLHEVAQLLESRDPYVRREAALALARCGPMSVEVLEELENAISRVGKLEDTTLFAVEAVGLVGSPAKGSVGLLRSKLGKWDLLDSEIRIAIKRIETDIERETE